MTIEEIKAKARAYDITTELDKESFIDALLTAVENGEDTDGLIFDLFNEGFNELESDFDLVEELSEAEAMEEVKRVKD